MPLGSQRLVLDSQNKKERLKLNSTHKINSRDEPVWLVTQFIKESVN